MEKPFDEKVIIIGPAALNDKKNVRMAFHIIQDKTGILLILICPSSAIL